PPGLSLLLLPPLLLLRDRRQLLPPPLLLLRDRPLLIPILRHLRHLRQLRGSTKGTNPAQTYAVRLRFVTVRGVLPCAHAIRSQAISAVAVSALRIRGVMF